MQSPRPPPPPQQPASSKHRKPTTAANKRKQLSTTPTTPTQPPAKRQPLQQLVPPSPTPARVSGPFAGVRGPLQFGQVGRLRHAQTAAQCKQWASELLALADASVQPLLVGLDSESAVRWRQRDDGTWATTSQERVSLLQLCHHHPQQAQVGDMCAARLGFACASCTHPSPLDLSVPASLHAASPRACCCRWRASA